MESETKELKGKQEDSKLTKKQSVIVVAVITIIIIISIVIATTIVGVVDSKDKNKYHNFNEIIEFEQLEYTFLEYEIDNVYVNPITYNYTYPTNENNNLVSISLKLKNPTTKIIYLQESGWKNVKSWRISSLSSQLFCK